MSALLTAAQILAADDLPFEIVEVPEWGGSVRLRTMTAGEASAYGDSIRTATGGIIRELLPEKLLARCIVGDDGLPVFSEEKVRQLSGKSSLIIQRLFIIADRLNTVTEQKVEAALGN